MAREAVKGNMPVTGASTQIRLISINEAAITDPSSHERQRDRKPPIGRGKRKMPTATKKA